MAWTPRSQRLGMTDYDWPFEGVPLHLKPHLAAWLTETLAGTADPERACDVLALRLHIVLDKEYGGVHQIVGAAVKNDDLFLDCVEGALRLDARSHFTGKRDDKLDDLLALAGSAYKVSDDRLHLVDVASKQVEKTKTKALSVQDEASEELSEAWVKAYGRSPDASDAWDHAIKAVEAVLRPAVEPNNGKATLGSMIAVLNKKPSDWRCVFPGKDDDNSVENFVGTLRLIWPNPDRHGSGGRKPTLTEARAVVTLAATVVQWRREGTVVQKR